MNAGQGLFFCLILSFLFLLTMNTDVHHSNTTSEIVDKTPAPAAASGKFKSLFFGGCFDQTRGTVLPETIYPLRHGKTSSLLKGPATNSPRWDEFLNLILDGRDRLSRQARHGISR